MKRINDNTIPDLLGRALLAFALFCGVARTLWEAFALDALKGAWLVQLILGAALCLLLCAVAGKRAGLITYIAIAALLALLAAAASRYVSDGWSVVFNRIFSGFELRYGRIFPFFKSGLTKAEPDLCAALFLLYPTTLLAVCAARAASVRSAWRFVFPAAAGCVWLAAAVFRLPVTGLPPVLLAGSLAALRARSVAMKNAVPDGGRIVLPVLLILALLVGVMAAPAAVLAGGGEARAKALRDGIAKRVHEGRYHTASSPMPEGDFTKVSAFQPEEGTALDVTMDRPRTLYLRGYVGEVYRSDGWESLAPETLGSYATSFSWMHAADFYGQTQYAAAAKALAGEAGTERIGVENVSACSAYEYAPYALGSFPGPVDENAIGDARLEAKGLRGTRSFAYDVSTYDIGDHAALYAKLFDQPENEGGPGYEYLRYEGAYREFVYSEYLGVPAPVRQALMRFDELAAVPRDMHLSFGDAQRIVVSCLLAHFEYDEQPGPTPEGWDFTRWFVEESKRGYAPHFATAATLMFRSLGIPARYVEGYAIRDGEVAAAQDGRIQVPNANAHAWVEIYRDGVGWIPVEVTPPFVIQSPETAPNRETGSGGTSTVEPEPEEPPDQEPPQIAVILLGAAALLLLLALACILLRRRSVLKRRGRLLDAADNAEAVCWMTAYAVMLLEHVGVTRGNRSLFELTPEIGQALGEEYAAAFVDTVAIQQQAMFGSGGLDDGDRETVRAFTDQTLQKLIESTGRRERLRLKWVLCVY